MMSSFPSGFPPQQPLPQVRKPFGLPGLGGRKINPVTALLGFVLVLAVVGLGVALYLNWDRLFGSGTTTTPMPLGGREVLPPPPPPSDPVLPPPPSVDTTLRTSTTTRNPMKPGGGTTSTTSRTTMGGRGTTPKAVPAGSMPITEAEYNQMAGGAGRIDSDVPQRFRPYFTFGRFSDAWVRFPELTRLDRQTARRVIAGFLANVTQETAFLVAEERACTNNVCRQYGGDFTTADGCNGNTPRCFLHGRGPFQTTWRSNYSGCSRHLFNDDRLVERPWIILEDAAIGWGCALWFFCHNPGVNYNRTGRTMLQHMLEPDFVNAAAGINGALECGTRGPYNDLFRNRIRQYQENCRILGVEPGPIRPDCSF